MDPNDFRAPEGTSADALADATNRAQLVARIAGHFMSLGPEQLDAGIDEALRAVGEFSNVDRCYLFRLDSDTFMSNTHEWCADGIEPVIESLQEFACDVVPWFMERIRRGEVVHAPAVRELPDEAAAERREWSRQGIRSLICVPLASAGRVVGFLGLDCVRRAHRWSERAVELLRSVGGIVVGAINQMRAQRALRESRSHLEKAQGAARLGLWTWDVASDRVIFSENTYRIYGLDPATFDGTIESTLAIFHPDDVPRARAVMQRSLREKVGLEFDFRIVRPDGGVRRIHSEGHVYLDAAGEPDRVVGVVQDVTEEREAEEERRRLATAIEQVADAVTITSAEGVIRYVNRAFEALTGHRRAALIGRDRRYLRHAEQDAAEYLAIADAVNRGEVWSGRVRVRRSDGTPVLMDTTVSPVHSDSGAILQHVTVQRDVTHEAALEEQLRQGQKMEAIGMLAGGIAHDFNNLLIAIIGHSDLLLMRRGEDEEVRRHVEEIGKAGERAKALTSQLLAFSRKQVLCPRTLDLGAGIGDLADLLRRVIGEDVELRVLEPVEPTLVEADPGQMEQVVVNLATNARDAMPAGGTLEIAVTRVTPAPAEAERLEGLEARPYALLTVRDTGLGMDDTTRARIFEPFFTTKDVGQGTGLGLATAYGIVRQSGGIIHVDSAVGAGSVFRVYLPIVEAADEAARPEERTPEPTSGSEVVLVVEDDAAVADIVCNTLRDHGYTVLYAENGRHALEVLEAQPRAIDLLFTDVVMPEMGGVQLAALLTAQRPGLRVLFSSGYTDSALMRRGSLVEGVALLQKPFSPSALARRVRAALDAPAD